MPKFNRGSVRAAVTSPVRTVDGPATTTTHEGGPAWIRDTRSDAFLLGMSNLVGEDTFYEDASTRDARWAELVRALATGDGPWLARFLPWLRSTGNMRSAPLVGAAEAVHARLAAASGGDPWVSDGVRNRALISSVMLRADEPGEFLAYWVPRFGGKLPMSVKRGLADAAVRLYTEYSLLKYDTASHGFRFSDVIELCHPSPVDDRQDALFRFALDRRHRPETVAPPVLRMIAANRALRLEAVNSPALLTDPARLAEAGMSWEDALSVAGPSVSETGLWEALAPNLGYMAALRNLRNMDEAGVSDAVAAKVAERLADPDQVAHSRQFPFRFWSAYTAAPSLRWGWALERALSASVRNIPALPGRSLVLVDTSASMTSKTVSERSKVTVAVAAALFGVSLASRAHTVPGASVDLVGFATGSFLHTVPGGGSVLKGTESFVRRTGEVGHGTDIGAALRQWFRGHDRVFILSDMQTIGQPAASLARMFGGGYGSRESLNEPRTVSELVPAEVPVYAFNLGGYSRSAIPTGSGTRHEIGGLTDATFRLIPLLERGVNADWPF